MEIEHNWTFSLRSGDMQSAVTSKGRWNTSAEALRAAVKLSIGGLNRSIDISIFMVEEISIQD